MDIKIEFSAQAFSKMVMHAMKHPHAVCSGILLSSKPEGEGDQSVTRVREAIPISHLSQFLAPSIEIAFNAIKKYAQDQELVISGYYQTDRFNEIGCPDPFNQRVADKIYEHYPNAVLCFVGFEESIVQSFLEPYQFTDGKWRRKNAREFTIECDLEVIADNILYSRERLYRKIVDFDDHFNDIQLDWTNAFLSQRIDSLVNVC